MIKRRRSGTMKVLVSDKLTDAGLEILRGAEGLEVDNRPAVSHEELKEVIGSYHGLIIRSRTRVTADIIKAADNLRVIGRAGLGLENVDLAAASKRGIVVMNTPLANTLTTAEHAFSMMLALARSIPQAHATMKDGLWEKGRFIGVEVYNKTMGVIGLGNIGSAFSRLAQGAGMELIACDPFINREKADEQGIELVELEELFDRADFISIHTPLTDDTRHLINTQTIALMKDSVRIINCARGGIINEEELAEALASGKVAGAALDVFEKEPVDPDNPLLKLGNVICTPHLGTATREAQGNVALAVAEQVADFFRGNIRNAVNMPSVDAEIMSRLKPYLVLAEKLGLFLGQMSDGRMQEVNLVYSGEVADLDIRPVSMTILEGVLRPILKEKVNLVNAPHLARERGVKISETTRREREGFTDVIEVTMVTDKGENSVAGTLLAGQNPRIVRVNGFNLEAVPEGHMLVFSNIDQPGVIGRIGNLLGDSQVNIAGFKLGRVKPTGEAVAIVNIDSPIPEDVIEQIRDLPFIHFARQVQL
jgi:D-3-phosphoglycerate dehydrogenase